MMEDIPGSRGHPVTGKVSYGSARMTPSYRPKWRSFEMNPSIVTAIQIHILDHRMFHGGVNNGRKHLTGSAPATHQS